MRDVCIQNFLHKSDREHVERHSDSSDFEIPTKLPAVAKSTNHTVNDRSKIEMELFHSQHWIKGKKECKEYFIKGENSKHADAKSNKQKQTVKIDDNTTPVKQNCNNNMNTAAKHKVIYVDGNSRYLMDIDAEKARKKVKYSKFHRKPVIKLKRHCQTYAVQPIYLVQANNHDIFEPFDEKNTNNQQINYNPPKSNLSNDLVSSSESEHEIKNYKLQILSPKLSKQVEKKRSKHSTGKRKSHKDVDGSKADLNKEQQFPSKLLLYKSYNVYDIQKSNCNTTDTGIMSKLTSSSSAFWKFLAEKVSKKYPTVANECNKKACDCNAKPEPCYPDTCENFENVLDKVNYIDQVPKYSFANSCCQQTEPLEKSSGSFFNKLTQDSKQQTLTTKVHCKCSTIKKKSSSKSSIFKTQKTKDANLDPCREKHDDIIKSVANKYNGEILCIHNPPCILINGCLNLPPAKIPMQSNFWPVTQSKKSSFGQMCRKMKSSKNKFCEEAIYQPPYTELEKCLPEFKNEKNIQSICNHDPPCDNVHRCFRVQYDPKLENSCVHVPMCQKYPKCLLERINWKSQDGMISCDHKPKCAEIPLCSRKFVVLTAKENIATQVKPKTKLVCRHDPPCLMIPECLARCISHDYVPLDAIPDCTHHPYCELIPACCRKSAKQMVSVTSQYPPPGCRIV